MRITLDIDEELLKDVVKYAKEKSKKKAVNKALRKFVSDEAIEGILALAGKIDLIDNWYELRHMEPR